MEIEIRGINYTFQGIPKGEFVMGANDFLSNAAPPHRVIITSDFYMLETPVTQRMWETIMGNNIDRKSVV